MMVSQEDIERLRELLARPAQNIVIVSHTNPDGDAVGSSLAWREALLEMGHRVTCIVPNKYPYFLDWMTGIENLVLFKTDEAGVARRAVEESDLIFFLDFNAVSRLEGLSEVIESNTTARRILIDHHLSPGPGFDLMFSCTGSSSTSFLIYRILEKMLGTQAITRSMAESLYVGMMTDTGNFSFSFLTPELYRAVAVLVETGIVADKDAAMDLLASVGRRTWDNDDSNSNTVHSVVYDLTDKSVLWVGNEHYGEEAYTFEFQLGR